MKNLRGTIFEKNFVLCMVGVVVAVAGCNQNQPAPTVPATINTAPKSRDWHHTESPNPPSPKTELTSPPDPKSLGK